MHREFSQPRAIAICPGIHAPPLTEAFLAGLQRQAASDRIFNGTDEILIFPAADSPPYSAPHILAFLQRHLAPEEKPLIFISFSAGVAGAIGAAWAWQLLGGKVEAFIGADGWGVPLCGNFPIYRLSHDYFTHWSSALLGGGEESFYADPAIEHLDLWGKPDTCKGWWVQRKQGGKSERRIYTTAANFVVQVVAG